VKTNVNLKSKGTALLAQIRDLVYENGGVDSSRPGQRRSFCHDIKNSMIALQRILLTILFVSSAGSQAAIAQKLQLTKSSAWNAAYEAMCPVDGNELARFRVDPSLQAVLDLALSQSDGMRSERPLVRVIYQRAAWYAFDSLATAADRLEGGNQAVRLRLARIIALCTLTDDEIKALSNTYTGTAIGDDRERNPAFDIDLPSDLFDKDGEWIQLTYDKLQRIALTHEKSRNGRNEFLLFVRFPGGREQAEAYLNDHNAH
jgi:hypothetical protein